MPLIRLYNDNQGSTPSQGAVNNGKIRLYQDTPTTTPFQSITPPNALISNPVPSTGQGIFQLAKNIFTGLKDQYTNPSPDITGAEAIAGVGAQPKNILDKISQPVSDFVTKAVYRTFGPLLNPLGKDVAEIIATNEIAPKVASGELPTTALDQLEVLKKTAPQIAGDVSQAVLAAYSPSLISENIASGVGNPILKALAAGGAKGAGVGLGFGVSQAASSGTKNPWDFAQIVAENILTMGIFGAITEGIIPVTSEVFDKVAKEKERIKTELISKGVPEPQAEIQANHAGVQGSTETQTNQGKIKLYPEEVPTAEPAKQPLQPVGTGETKVVGLAAGVEQKAIENKLTKGLGDLPEYQTVSMEEQAKLASDLITKDYQKARDIALGKEQPPQGVIPEAVFIAVENKALKEHDVATITQLANSDLTSQATAMGQRIRTLGERNPDSPVAAIQDITTARQTRAEKALNIPKEKKAIIDEVKKEIKKNQVTKETWNSFIDSLEC